MGRKLLLVITVVGALAMPGPPESAWAAETTVGNAAQPFGSAATECGASIVGMLQSSPANEYAIPTGGGVISGWQVNTAGARAGSALTLVLLHRSGDGYYVIDAIDTEFLRSPFPEDGIERFEIADPILAEQGDTVGLYAPGGGVACAFHGGDTPQGNFLFSLSEHEAPVVGERIWEFKDEGPVVLNLAATVLQEQDAGVTTTVGPPDATAGALATLTSTVTNGGPGLGPITFTDNVPAGLSIQSAVAASGACAVVAQMLTCTISGLDAGESTPVLVTVTPTIPGSYTNRVSVAPAAGTPDPNPTNNAASATLSVGQALRLGWPAPVSRSCVVPAFAGVGLRAAKKLLALLDCRIGRVMKAHSKKIPRGRVVKTTPATGTFPAGTSIVFTESSGPRKPKHRKR